MHLVICASRKMLHTPQHWTSKSAMMDNGTASALFWMATNLSTFYFMLSCNVACLATLSQTLKKGFPVKLTVLPFDWSGLLSLSLSFKKRFSENRQCSHLIGQDLRLFPIDLLAESVICASGQFLERTAVCETQNILISSILLWNLQHSSDHQFYWSIEMSLDWY